MNPFSLTGPLPATTTLLEASAGTGKTYAIAALATRFLAERGDLDVTQLLMITFGNHAAGELRSRVFERLQRTHRFLNRHLAGEDTSGADDVDLLLMATDAEARRDRLAVALAHYNEATITTTHAFCETMLRELGVLADWDRDEKVGPDDRDIASQCAADTYLRLYRDDPQPPLTPGQAIKVGVAACCTSLPLLPDEGQRKDFAEAVRRLYAARKAAESICTFDDVIGRLRRALTDPCTEGTVRESLAGRFPVVLVDEFQDTDPEQWDIIERAFVASHRPTILIGDPKQSIYGFRGADLGSYLRARQAAQVYTLATNHRSDAPLVQGIVNLFGDTELGSAQVRVTPVETQHGCRLIVPGEARLWLRRANADTLVTTDAGGAIDNDVVRQIRALLQHAALVTEPGASMALRPADIAILTRTTARARSIRRTLTDAGLPAVLTGSQSVWEQEGAEDWRRLLRAMAEPTQANIRLAAMTPLIGAQLEALLSDATQEPARVSTLVRELGHAFDTGGVGAVVIVLRARTGLDARVLAEADGARRLTDLLHVAELLDASGATSLPGLIAEVGHRDHEEETDSIRIESDDDAIRVMTMHAAKGLEFPVVLLPETDGTAPRLSQPFTVIEHERRHLYIGARPGWHDQIAVDARQQGLEEELRLLYVGLTRARHLTIAWHVSDATRRSTEGPLSVLLKQHGSSHRRGSPPGPIVVPFVHDSLLDETVPPPTAAPGSINPLPELRLATMDRVIDRTWRRTSYSGLTQSLHESGMHVASDEPAELDLTPQPPVVPELAQPSPMATLPAGTGFGTLVHAALEHLDWAPGHVEQAAAGLMAELGPANGLEAAESATLASALVSVCRTPLQPLTGLCLSELPVSDRLPELDFDLPLADGGEPATIGELADLMATMLPPGDPLIDYPRRLGGSEAAPAVLNGFLTGSIDAVLRLPGGRFVVVDYKTNRLSPTVAEPLTLGHYTQPRMAEAMMQAHYPLQAMLYCVALHRYLSMSLPGYDPDLHLGGVGYLFVRGMAGPATPVFDGASCGVFGWFPPTALVLAASDLLGGDRA